MSVVEGMVNVGAIGGSDVAGDVVRVGASVTSVKIGDRVAAFVPGSIYTDRGGFAEYVKIPAELTWKIPDGTTYEAAATLSAGYVSLCVPLRETKLLSQILDSGTRAILPQVAGIYRASEQGAEA